MENRFHLAVGALFFGIRDIISPPIRKLQEVGIESGDVVLDYGCGIGGYTLEAARLVGETGRVYAADVNPSALSRVERRARRRNLRSINTILTDRDLPLDDETVNVVILYDVLHDLERSDLVLEELHRVLKPDGTFSVSDHHMGVEEVVGAIGHSGLFVARDRGDNTLSFGKS